MPDTPRTFSPGRPPEEDAMRAHLNLMLPADLKDRAADAALADSRSLSAWVRLAIEEKLERSRRRRAS